MIMPLLVRKVAGAAARNPVIKYFSSKAVDEALMHKAYSDGACRGNPGHGSCGAALYSAGAAASSSVPLAVSKKYLGPNETNNSCEYQGAILAIQLANKYDVKQLILRTDSQLLVKQLLGVYKVKDEKLRKWLEIIHRDTKRDLDYFRIEHVPRKDNAVADKLANIALNEELKPI